MTPTPVLRPDITPEEWTEALYDLFSAWANGHGYRRAANRPKVAALFRRPEEGAEPIDGGLNEDGDQIRPFQTTSLHLQFTALQNRLAQVTEDREAWWNAWLRVMEHIKNWAPRLEKAESDLTAATARAEQAERARDDYLRSRNSEAESNQMFRLQNERLTAQLQQAEEMLKEAGFVWCEKCRCWYGPSSAHAWRTESHEPEREEPRS